MILDELIKSANDGDVYAQYEIGQKYYNGDGVNVDLNQSVYWYNRASKQGDISALLQLAYIFI